MNSVTVIQFNVISGKFGGANKGSCHASSDHFCLHARPMHFLMTIMSFISSFSKLFLCKIVCKLLIYAIYKQFITTQIDKLFYHIKYACLSYYHKVNHNLFLYIFLQLLFYNNDVSIDLAIFSYIIALTLRLLLMMLEYCFVWSNSWLFTISIVSSNTYCFL